MSEFDIWIEGLRKVVLTATGSSAVDEEAWVENFERGQTPLEAWLEEYPEDAELFDEDWED